MTRGTLSFALDGDFFGIAFQDEKLKQGPIFAAISLLHNGGCMLVSGLQVPEYFILEDIPENVKVKNQENASTGVELE
eukprot:CAMPEP_0116887082 /NCGR_PEP_ID=MMETSP0463-20121206/21248_1 /TAXON_ID=181622 /ORGANISM="Strombidinopsis sp, Strain SopsisLIS2011" /LENGTH=77 /DNA_ID=CAMNT_0004548779 /DNA_START=1167 /DNA_END=1400 /DNA_ORIENTATION=+